MATIYLEAGNQQEVKKIVPTWTPKDATDLIYQKFQASLKQKKNYAENLDYQDMEAALKSVKDELRQIINRITCSPVSIKLYTEGPFFGNNDLYIEYRTVKETKKIKLNVDWSSVKANIKRENASVKEQTGKTIEESKRFGKAEQELRAKGAPTSWRVLGHSDISQLLNQAIGREAAETLNLGPIPVDVFIEDKTVLLKLAKAAKNPSVIEKITLAANWPQIIKNTVTACNKAAALIKDNPADRQNAERMIQETLNDEIQKATGRAIGASEHFSGLDFDYTKYQVVAFFKVTINVFGVAAGIAGIVLAPLTLGAGAIASAAALWRSCVQLREQLGKLSQEAETTANLIAPQVVLLLETYKNSSSTAVGLREVSKELFLKTAIPSDLIPTIKSVRNLLDTLDNKIHGIEIEANKLSEKLEPALDFSDKAFKHFSEFQAQNRNDDQLKGYISTLIKESTARQKEVEQLIEAITTLNERVNTCRGFHTKLNGGYKLLEAKNPTWAVVANEFIPIATDVGLMVGSGIGGAADYFGSMGEAAKTTVDIIGIVTTGLNDVTEAVENIQTEIKNRKSKS